MNCLGKKLKVTVLFKRKREMMKTMCNLQKRENFEQNLRNENNDTVTQ